MQHLHNDQRPNLHEKTGRVKEMGCLRGPVRPVRVVASAPADINMSFNQVKQ